eukprot:5719033-Pleurochrysis_carterae.AAC.1
MGTCVGARALFSCTVLAVGGPRPRAHARARAEARARNRHVRAGSRSCHPSRVTLLPCSLVPSLRTACALPVFCVYARMCPGRACTRSRR